VLREGLEIGAQVARVLIEILMGTELQRVDEDRDHDGVGQLTGPIDQFEMTLVQSAHGRDQRNGAARELLAQRGDGLDDDRATLFGAAGPDILPRVKSVLILACGTSYYSSLVAKQWIETLTQHGVGYVFAPSVGEMYPNGGTEVTVTGGEVATLFEGRSRPGHFDGVLTVVAKLLGIARPDYVVFGQKDAQQVFLVQLMVADLNFATRVEVVPTVRAADGLALSSRNRYLNPEERRAATALSRALEAAASAADRGIDAVLAAAQSVFMDERLVKLEYLKVVNPRTFLPVDDGYRGPARVLIAAQVGSTRLIDNDSLYLN